MNKDELNKIEEELDKSLTESSRIHKMQLDLTRNKLNEELKIQINNYSNEIRNISIASGIIAPFSLTLLDIKSLDINSTFLLLGFLFLLLNIAVSNILMNKFVKDRDIKMTKAGMHWFFAEFDSKDMQDGSKDYSERVIKNFDFSKNIRKVDDALGFSNFDMESEKEKSRLRKFNKISVRMFSIGIGFTMLSVVINPVALWVVKTISFLTSR